MRKPPPISTSSPREMTTSPPFATVVKASSTAAALLLTTSAASAPGDALQQFLNLPAPPAALAGCEVQFQIGVVPGDSGDGFHGGRRKRGAAHVGMNDNAGRIDDPLQAPQIACLQTLPYGGENGLFGERRRGFACENFLTQGIQFRP